MYDIQQKDNFVLRFEQTVKECWNDPALNDYKAPVKTYGQLAEDIEKMNLLWKAAGLVKGDKVAINAKSSAAWATVFFAAQAGGFVAVQIFNAFTPSDIMSLTNHSDSKVLYTEKAIFDKMDFASMPTILAAIDIKSGELLASRGGFADLYNNVDALFAKAHPQGLTPEAVNYDAGTLDDTCAIM